MPNTFSNKESIAHKESLHNQLKKFIPFPSIVGGGGFTNPFPTFLGLAMSCTICQQSGNSSFEVCMTQSIGNYPETDQPWRAMRRTATSRDVAVGSDMHDYDEGSAKRRRSQLPTRESEIAWSLHDGNVAFAADDLNQRKCHLPWETGYAGMVLSNRMPKLFHLVGDDPMQVGRADFIRGAASSSSVVSHIALLPKLPGHVRCLKLMSWHIEPDGLKRSALCLVRIMIESDLSATQVGKIMHDMAYNLSEEHRIRQLLEDTFAKKSPATLYKRARSCWKYFEWMKGSYSDALHLSEARIYGYVCHLRESSAAPTSAKAFLESVNFFPHVLGFTACDISTAVSSRVRCRVQYVASQKASSSGESFVGKGSCSLREPGPQAFLPSHWHHGGVFPVLCLELLQIQ